MDRLQNNPDINSKINFTKVNPSDRRRALFYILYSASMTVADVVSVVYTLASRYKITDVALVLQGIIKRAFKDIKTLP